MHNLHLMSMPSGFNTSLMDVINEHFPHEDNYFVWKNEKNFPHRFDNAVIDPKWFNPEYINAHHEGWDQIFLHELFLNDQQILLLNDDTAKKITWVVWGHDLYRPVKRPQNSVRSVLKYLYKRTKYYAGYLTGLRRRVARKVGQFRRIAIGFPYDEAFIRKKYGNKVCVAYGPYFSRQTARPSADRLRRLHQEQSHDVVNILVGHCGARFIQHEKYLRKLSAYKNENIHIYLVLSYLASEKRIAEISRIAGQLFTRDRYTILTDLMPRDDYYDFLTTIDIAIFPFRHQSALGNTKRLAYMGAKLYFDPKGVLAKGFLQGGVKTYNCHKIGRISFEEFCKKADLPETDRPLFDAFDYGHNVQAWKTLLSE